jgi:hypothetical protein
VVTAATPQGVNCGQLSTRAITAELDPSPQRAPREAASVQHMLGSGVMAASMQLDKGKLPTPQRRCASPAI